MAIRPGLGLSREFPLVSKAGAAIMAGLLLAAPLCAQVRPRFALPDTLRLPNQLVPADSSAIYRTVVRDGAGVLDSLAKGHRPWLHVPAGIVADLASERSGRTAPAPYRGVCDGTPGAPCPAKGHWFVAVGRLTAFAEDSARVPLSEGWNGPRRGSIRLFPYSWTVERDLEVGIFPEVRVVRDGVFEPVFTPEFILAKRGREWHITGFRLEAPPWYSSRKGSSQ